MPGFPLTLAAVASCFHQGRATIAPDQTAVMIQGALAATSASLIAVAGCPFTPVAYHPCVTIRWLLPSTKVTAQGKPLILMPPPGAGVGPGLGLAADQAPQGPPTVMTNQLNVLVT